MDEEEKRVEMKDLREEVNKVVRTEKVEGRKRRGGQTGGMEVDPRRSWSWRRSRKTMKRRTRKKVSRKGRRRSRERRKRSRKRRNGWR